MKKIFVLMRNLLLSAIALYGEVTLRKQGVDLDKLRRKKGD